MAFFDRLNEMAKTVSEKTNDSLEINKLIGEINLTKGNIQSFQRELGEHFWAKFVTGEQFDDEAMMICDKIVAAQDKIHGMEAQIAQIKAEGEARKAEREAELKQFYAARRKLTVKRNAQNARRQKRRRRQSRRQKGRALKRSLCLSARNAARCLPRDRNSAVNVASR